MKHTLSLAVAFTLSLVNVCAQQEAPMAVPIPMPFPDQSPPFEAEVPGSIAYLFHQMEKRLAGGTYDDTATPVLRASERFTEKLFQVSGLHLRRAVTYRDEGGDNLLAEWTPEEKFGANSIIVEDTPYQSVYRLRLAGCRVSSGEDARALLLSLLRVEDSPLEFLPEDVGTMYWSFAQGAGFTGTLGMLPSASPVMYSDDVQAVSDGKQWYLELKVGKGLIEGYPVPSGVADRFPPLPDAVKTWTDSRIRAEVGKPTGWRMLDSTVKRDVILVTELIRRGATQGQLLDLLREAQVAKRADRVMTIKIALDKAGKPEIVRDLIAPAAKILEPDGQQAEEALLDLFRPFLQTVGCEVDLNLEKEAVDILKRGVLSVGPVVYLEDCGRSPEALLAVEAAHVPEEKRISQESAVRNLRERIAKQRK